MRVDYSGSHCSWTVSGMPTVEGDKESIGTSGIWRYRTPQEPGPNITAHRYRAEEEGFSPVVTGTRFEDGFSWVAARGFAPKKRRLRQQRWLRGAAARRRQDRDADVSHRHGGTYVAKLSDGSRRRRLQFGDLPRRRSRRARRLMGTLRAVRIRPPCKASTGIAGADADSRVDQSRREATKCSGSSLSPVAPRTVSPQALRAPGPKTASCR